MCDFVPVCLSVCPSVFLPALSFYTQKDIEASPLMGIKASPLHKSNYQNVVEPILIVDLQHDVDQSITTPASRSLIPRGKPHTLILLLTHHSPQHPQPTHSHHTHYHTSIPSLLYFRYNISSRSCLL